MKAVRGPRALALAVVGALMLVGTLFGVAAPASATAGLIDGYVFELDGTTPMVGATVLFDDGSDPPAYVTTSTDVDGYYFFTPAPTFDDEFFEIVVFGGSAHLDASDSGYYETSDPGSGAMDDFLLGPARRIRGIVKDAATATPLENVVVVAIGTSAPYASLPPTDNTGVFDIGVPPGDDYSVVAIQGPTPGDVYDPQFYDHINFSSYLQSCGCTLPDPVTVPAGVGAPITGIDFDLYAYDEWIYFSVAADDLAGFAEPGVLVHLDRRTGPAAWDLDVDTGVTNGAGLVDLFGEGDGGYRLRYSVGGVYKAIDSWYEPTFPAWPLYDSGRSVQLDGLTTTPLDPCGCGNVFTTLEVDLVFPVASSGGGAGGGGGGGTSGTPRWPVSTEPTLVTPTATPTPTPTVTSTPSPSSSPTSEPSPTPTPDPVPTQNALELWWLWLLLLLIVALIIFFIVRALLRR